MTFEEFVIAIVASVGGILLVGFIVAKITGLIKAWLNRNSSEIREEDFNRLAKAFMEYKKDTQRRLQNLEAIVADEDNTTGSSKSSKQIEAPKKSIEIEDQDAEEEESKTQSGNEDNNLRNMLRE